ncbi:MAG: DUF4837 family protein [Bacteroidales bacterium]|nr:DUF4837 family protein [Bacteroidales bacterium]MCF8455252.1 DUF4837 family protein [Bacteroidales bacterium]
MRKQNHLNITDTSILKLLRNSDIRLSYFILLPFLILMMACNPDNTGLMPNVTGKAGEVVIVIDKQLWEGPVGDAFIKQLAGEVPALPQGEPMFDLIDIPRAAFTDIFQTHRNLILTSISKNVKEPIVKVRKDVYAKPQIAIQIEVNSKEQLLAVIEERGAGILDKLVEKERERIITNYRNFEEPGISAKLRKLHNLSMIFPRGYSYDLDTTNFAWIAHETPEISQGILVYYYDYKDTSSFNKENLISKRDEILQKYVLGPVDNTYMTTEKDLPISYREFILNERYTTEISGLWKLDGPAFMGGPFVSLSTVDTLRNRVVTVEGFVFAPKQDKRNYLRQVEAILYSLRIVGPEEKE